MQSNNFRFSFYNRFMEYWKFYFPNLRTTRLASDACDSCIRIDIALKEPDIKLEEKEELETQKSVHLITARDQRRAMNSAVKHAITSWEPDEISNLEHDFIYLHLNDSETKETDCQKTDEDNQQIQEKKLRKVIVLCEDFGQSIAMPHYGYELPGSDYFNSNLMMHEFVVADRVSNTNTVYFYDERKFKKDGESMCNLRLYHHLNMLEKYLENGLQLPTSYICVMDNCCGQNKSKLIFIFFQLLSILFYENIFLNFLLPGHSHMAADRVVSWVRYSLGRNNIYTPQQLFDKVNSIKNVTAVDVSKLALFDGFNNILKKYFQEMPNGYTKYYYYEFSKGKCFYKYHAEASDSEIQEFTFCYNVSTTKIAILRELFGETTIEGLICNKNILLPNYRSIKLPDSKIQSLKNKYSTIPVQFLWYYPNFDGNQDTNLIETNVDYNTRKKRDRNGKEIVPTKNPVGRPKKMKVADESQLSILSFTSKKKEDLEETKRN